VNVAILTVGSRGDVQPFVALGVGLKEAGHQVTLATGRSFEAFVSERGLRHAALDVDLLEDMQSPEGKGALSGKNLPRTMKKLMPMFRRMLDEEWTASRGADAVVYHPKALVATTSSRDSASPVSSLTRSRCSPRPAPSRTPSCRSLIWVASSIGRATGRSCACSPPRTGV
jgi:UDP:flavonoid glycosyltransferase YjiC (YdhE family)